MDHLLKKSSLIFLIGTISFFIIPISGLYSATDSLKYVVHSFAKIKTAEGKVLYIDPFGVNEFSDSADVVLITHEHSDHNDLSRIKIRKSGIVIRASQALVGGIYQNFTIGNIKIKAVPAYNSNHAKASCVGYLIDLKGIKIYHPGDTGKITEMADLAAEKISYAFIPMDGTYTMTPEAATEAAALIKAKYDIPIHTTAGTLSYSDAMVARFASPNKMVLRPGSTIELKAAVTSVQKNEMPFDFALEQNYPNPFNPETIISYQLSVVSHVSLKVYNLLGKEVASLVDEIKQPGSYNSKFLPEAYLRDNSTLSSGIYFYTMKAGNYTNTKKMLLLK